MKIPFFASFIIFIVWLAYELSKTRRHSEKNESSFWEKEAQANRTRRKPLDSLNYITIPFDRLPMELLTEDERISECHRILQVLKDSPIVNFTGISNTELKLEYGAPNLNLLMRYDENYTTLAGTLQKWALLLYEAGYAVEAKNILEFAISTDTDVSGSYRLLSSIYTEEGQTEKIADLLKRAENLRSGSKDTIVHILQESYR
ncbi:hypothetical protein EDD76_11617 [Kineothrix alysoides]|uniref:Tetratricopeptide repeat protein n=1 Tax=Kineothrix alysoides TaxID=1469948 RepID=A0A4R1QPB6_9FIRM|nr:hypothetical protein [Kineothrix alysoides]TCL55177.1 hypothetical protein EDD76_11617 [Kineothrix alysoides]